MNNKLKIVKKMKPALGNSFILILKHSRIELYRFGLFKFKGGFPSNQVQWVLEDIHDYITSNTTKSFFIEHSIKQGDVLELIKNALEEHLAPTEFDKYEQNWSTLELDIHNSR